MLGALKAHKVKVALINTVILCTLNNFWAILSFLIKIYKTKMNMIKRSLRNKNLSIAQKRDQEMQKT